MSGVSVKWSANYLIMAAAILPGCGDANSNIETESPATLYRNSPLDPTLRIHWATFDAAESSSSYNIESCQMAARLLNANYRAIGGSENDGFGFWCEPGRYEDEGVLRVDFDAEYPTQ
jgi:hypothetical protein